MTDVPLLPCPPIDVGALTGRTVDLERLELLRHGDDLWEAIGRHEELWRWIPSGPFPEQQDFDDWLADRTSRPSQALYAVIDKTRPGRKAAGLYMALSINPDAGTTEVGLNLGERLSRKAGGTEAFLLLADYIMSRGYRRIEWRCTPENAASSRAASRLGFTLEGILRQTHWLKGGNWDTEVHAILDHEWPEIAGSLAAWLEPSNFDSQGGQLKPLSAF